MQAARQNRNVAVSLYSSMMEGSEAYESYATCIRRAVNDAEGKALCLQKFETMVDHHGNEQKKAQDAPRHRLEEDGGKDCRGLALVRMRR